METTIYGRVDMLVNNAGVLRDNQLVRVKDGELVKQMPEADFDLVVGVNLKGVFNCAQAVAPYMMLLVKSFSPAWPTLRPENSEFSEEFGILGTRPPN